MLSTATVITNNDLGLYLVAMAATERTLPTVGWEEGFDRHFPWLGVSTREQGWNKGFCSKGGLFWGTRQFVITPQEFSFSPSGNMPAPQGVFWSPKAAPMGGGEAFLYLCRFIKGKEGLWEGFPVFPVSLSRIIKSKSKLELVLGLTFGYFLVPISLNIGVLLFSANRNGKK